MQPLAHDRMMLFASHLGFSAEELEENRGLRLTTSQSTRLRKKALFQLLLPLVALAAMLAVAIILGLVLLGSVTGRFSAGRIRTYLLSGIVFALGGAGICFIEVSVRLGEWWALRRDIRVGKVAVIEGRVGFTRESVNGPSILSQHWYAVQGRHFAVPEGAEEALPNRGRTRIYYTPTSGLLLSAEPVGDSKVLDEVEPYVTSRR